MTPALERYGVRDVPDPARLRAGLFAGDRFGGLGLLRDLNDLLALATYVRGAWTAIAQAAMKLHEQQLHAECAAISSETDRQIAWTKTRLRLPRLRRSRCRPLGSPPSARHCRRP